MTDVVSQHKNQKQLIVADRKTWKKKTGDAMIYAVILSFVVIVLNIGQGLTTAMHLKEKVLAQTAEAYSALISGSQALLEGQEESAYAAFQSAQEQFAAVEQMIAVLTPQLQTTSFSLLDSGKAFFQGSKELAQAAETGAVFFQAAAAWTEQFSAINQTTVIGGAVTDTPALTQDLATVFEHLPPLVTAMSQAEESFQGVAVNDLPPQYRELFEMLRESVQTFHATLVEVYAAKQAILTLLGDQNSKKYMVLLQNNSEQRPTGGFIGSFLLLDVKDGVIGPISFNDVYDYDWRLEEDVEAPAEIAALTDNWRLRDANYSPNFPTSARQAMWFLQKEDGPAVDGVIAIDMTVFEDVLELIGPVQIERFQEPLTADTVQLVLSTIIESKLDGVESPKQIFHELIPAVIEQTFAAPPSLGATLGALQKFQSQGHIQAYFTDDSGEQLMRTLGIAGEVTPPQAQEDILQVVHSAIGGNKTDFWVEEQVLHKTFVASDGSLIDQVTITRTHTWTEAVAQAQEAVLANFGLGPLSDAVRSILGDGINKSALRVYVPQGANLVSVQGIEQTEIQTIQDTDVAQTYFRFVMETPPGTSTTVTLNYTLPFTLNGDDFMEYNLIMRPQSGAINQTMTHQFVLPDSLQIYAQRTITLAKEMGTKYAALIGQ